MSGKYRLLFRYLEERYAQTVVLTFGEIEDLLGFSLPDQARLSEGWWTDAAEAHGSEPHYRMPGRLPAGGDAETARPYRGV